MRDRAAAARYVDGRARKRGPDVDDEPAAHTLRDTDRNREFADALECEPGTEAVRLKGGVGGPDSAPSLGREHPSLQCTARHKTREGGGHCRRESSRMKPAA